MEGEDVDLFCLTNEEKFSYCTFKHPNNVFWVKYKFDDDAQKVMEISKFHEFFDNFDYTGDDQGQTCKITLKNVNEEESGEWKCIIEGAYVLNYYLCIFQSILCR